MSAEPRRRLLIVDDTEAFRVAAAAEANSSGRFSSVTTAVDGQQALDAIRQLVSSGNTAELPEVILTDLYMPNMNGIELMLALKRHPATAGILGVMVSVCESPTEKSAAKSAGCRAFFLKSSSGTGMKGLIEAVAWLATSPRMAA